MKQYRFYFHYNKPKKCMSVHFKNACHLAKNVCCTAPVESHWKERQPHLVMRGWAAKIYRVKDTIFIVSGIKNDGE